MERLAFIKPKYNVGDTAWLARAYSKDVAVPCPACLGKKYLTVIMGDGESVTIDCSLCQRGYLGSLGVITESQFTQEAEQITITSVHLSNGKFEYNYKDEADVLPTKEEALLRAAKLGEDAKIAQENSLKFRKENEKKTWSWNAAYHRRGLKEALRQVEYHTAKLNVAKEKAKEDKTA